MREREFHYFDFPLSPVPQDREEEEEEEEERTKRRDEVCCHLHNYFFGFENMFLFPLSSAQLSSAQGMKLSLFLLSTLIHILVLTDNTESSFIITKEIGDEKCKQQF